MEPEITMYSNPRMPRGHLGREPTGRPDSGSHRNGPMPQRLRGPGPTHLPHCDSSYGMLPSITEGREFTVAGLVLWMAGGGLRFVSLGKVGHVHIERVKAVVEESAPPARQKSAGE